MHSSSHSPSGAPTPIPGSRNLFLVLVACFGLMLAIGSATEAWAAPSPGPTDAFAAVPDPAIELSEAIA